MLCIYQYRANLMEDVLEVFGQLEKCRGESQRLLRKEKHSQMRISSRWRWSRVSWRLAIASITSPISTSAISRSRLFPLKLFRFNQVKCVSNAWTRKRTLTLTQPLANGWRIASSDTRITSWSALKMRSPLLRGIYSSHWYFCTTFFSIVKQT